MFFSVWGELSMKSQENIIAPLILFDYPQLFALISKSNENMTNGERNTGVKHKNTESVKLHEGDREIDVCYTRDIFLNLAVLETL